MIRRNAAVGVAMAGLCVAGVAAGQWRADDRVGQAGFDTAVVDSPFVVSSRETQSELATPLDVSLADMGVLRAAERVHMLSVPISGGELVDLDLRRIRVFAETAEFVQGRNPARSLDEVGRRDRNATFGGTVAGAPGSRAYVSITGTGVNGYITVDGATHVISSGDPRFGEPRPVVFNMNDVPQGVIEWKDFVCNAIDPASMRDLDAIELGRELDRVDQNMHPVADAPRSAAGGFAGVAPLAPSAGPAFGTEPEPEDECRVVNVAIEVDEEFGVRFGTEEALLDYIDTLIGATSFIYLENVNLQFNVIYTRHWIGEPTGTDPWSGFSTADVLFQLKDEWTPLSAPTAQNWNGVHLLSSRNLGGGIAFLSAMCDQDFAHAVSANLNGFFPTVEGTFEPIDNNSQNWDITVVSHEWGHNLGAPHTHGLVPPHDSCGLGDCANSSQGTIMSYCHTCPGGMTNIELAFTDRILNEGIRPFLEGGASCNLAQASEVCEGTVTMVCLPDINEDMRLSPADFTAWLVAYNAGDLRADMNLDRRLTPSDFNAWLVLYNAGCDFGDG